MIVDKYKRPVSYLRISLTDRCNLRCRYCMPANGVDLIKNDDILTYEEILRIVEIFKKTGVTRIRATGGEPFVRKNIFYLLKAIKDKNTELYISSNLNCGSGIIKKINDLDINGINISLDSVNPETYSFLTRGGDVNTVINNIKKLTVKNKKVNTVIIKDINDKEITPLIEFCLENDLILRFIEKMKWTDENLNFVSNSSIRDFLIKKNIIETNGKPIHNSVAIYHKIKGESQKIGFISPITEPFCYRCHKIRVTSNGIVKPCLFSSDSLDLKQLLRHSSVTDEYIITEIKKIMCYKPEQGCIKEGGQNMFHYGG